MAENDKDMEGLIAGAAAIYGIFVLVVGALFTLMLLFGTPAEQG